jgi:osmotically-inducible protein OsmY
MAHSYLTPPQTHRLTMKTIQNYARLFISTGLVTFLSTFATADVPTDEAIAAAIEVSLFNDPYAAPNDTEISVIDGVATLQGTVSSIQASSRTAAIAESRRGVRSVVNLIKVEPRPVANEELKERVARALRWDPVAKQQEVTVEVTDGSIKLRGLASSIGAKREVARVASRVRGVKAVSNFIEVDFGAPRTDDEIQAHIVKRWRWHTYIDPDNLRIDVKDGVVVVSGAVGTSSERQATVHLAEVAGVKDIDASKLSVNPRERDKTQKTPRNLARSDEQIAEAIRDGWAHDPRVFSFEPELTVKKGFVTLRGKVGSLAAKNAAAQVARNTPGANLVQNHLKVRPKTPSRDDLAITDDIRKALVEDPGTDAYEIGVQVRDGNVILRGDIEEPWEKVRANVVVAGVDGVKTIKNRLGFEYDFFGDADNVLGGELLFSGGNGLPLVDEESIKARIEHELRWDTRFQDANITVEMRRRVVTLRGNAQNPSVRNDATVVAIQAGARSVANRIELLPKLDAD